MSTPVSPSRITNVTSTVLDRDIYLTRLLNHILEKVRAASAHGVNSQKSSWLQELQERAALSVRQSTIPTTRDEEWRFTDLSSLRQVEFNLETQSLKSIELDSLQTLPEAAHSRLVFVSGVYAPELSSVVGLPDGIIVSNLASLPEDILNSRVRNYLGSASGSDELFTSLNTIGMRDAAVVVVAKNVVVETPIHLLFISASSEIATVSFARCLVIAERGSQVSFVEEYTNLDNAKEAVYFTDAVTEIWLEDNAQVTHVRLQQDSDSAFHIGKTVTSQARYSRYSCHAIALGAKLSRHNLEIFQTGEQTETTLNGLTIVKGTQLADTHSLISLNHPYGKSQQLQKCIVGDRAHSVFNGKILVPKPAQLTNATQLNRNLLLSSKARVDTKPQLEITADNVKCSHGATVTQLEDDEIFYLQSRGIDENDARSLLINAFANEIINQIPVPSLVEKLIRFVN